YFFQGRPIRGGEVKDIVWLNPDGLEMSDADWNQASSRCLGVYLAGDTLLETDGRGQRLLDDNLLLLINADHEDVAFTLPEFEGHYSWDVLLDTFYATDMPAAVHYQTGQGYPVHGRALALLKQSGTQ
ncbi:MAG: glycogen debranching protein GlgX, partial [Acidiferrobacteraceae bacterium]